MGDLLWFLLELIFWICVSAFTPTREQRKQRESRRKLLREIEKRYEIEHPEEYRKRVEDSYRNITGGQTLPTERANLVEEGHRGGITALVLSHLIWYYTVTRKRERFLWYVTEIKRWPNTIMRQNAYCRMMKREIKKTLRRQRR